MEEGLFHNPIFVQQMSESAVCVVGHTEGHTMEKRRDPVTGVEREVCPHYDTIPCSAHQAGYQASSNFNFNAVPTSYVCTPDGKEFSKVQGAAPQQVIDQVTACQQKIPERPILGSQLRRWESELVKGDQKLAQGKYEDAKKSYEKVKDDEAILELVRGRAREKLAQLEQRAMADVDKAKALPAAQAKRELKKLVKALAAFPEPKAAAEAALAELEGEKKE